MPQRRWTATPQLSLLLLPLLTKRHYAPLLASANDFNPYTMNGGCITGISGKNYILLATDTRMTDGGYSILSRKAGLSSRIWRVHGRSFSGGTHLGQSMEDEDAECVLEEDVTQGAWIGAAGCQSDSDELRRVMQEEIAAHLYWSSSSSISSTGIDTGLSPNNIATTLGQVLYSRRHFPYYAFCLVAGLEPAENDSNNEDMVGVLHVYDAIGSHERVSVASAGMARNMMQPILDRLFLAPSSPLDSQPGGPTSLENLQKKSGKPNMKHVECNVQTAIQLLMQAYRAVAERDVTVGDEVVIYVVEQKKTREKNERIERKNIPAISATRTRWGISSSSTKRWNGTVKMLRFPLKKH